MTGESIFAVDRGRQVGPDLYSATLDNAQGVSIAEWNEFLRDPYGI